MNEDVEMRARCACSPRGSGYSRKVSAILIDIVRDRGGEVALQSVAIDQRAYSTVLSGWYRGIPYYTGHILRGKGAWVASWCPILGAATAKSARTRTQSKPSTASRCHQEVSVHCPHTPIRDKNLRLASRYAWHTSGDLSRSNSTATSFRLTVMLLFLNGFSPVRQDRTIAPVGSSMQETHPGPSCGMYAVASSLAESRHMVLITVTDGEDEKSSASS
ncbi:hypothetical protein C8Q72DRAFT_797289 [Fomitopsis betulina]|nr:hypothetical protein C8Q72DRAFT_797289 [Fomitopsis betulina]